jgi:AmmeMemoRadiSam system protein A
MKLRPEEKAFLRQLALAAVEAAVRRLDPPDPHQLAQKEGLELGPHLLAPSGVFVTLHRQDQLRGCIGYIEGHRPLVDAVVDNGRSAAVKDPRFTPVTEAELPSLTVELSVLTPLEPVAGPEEIVIGQHGIVLNIRGQRAVFLPQVAAEQGWDLATTLGHLSLKAGAGPQDWQEGATFQVFEAEVF